MSMRRVAKISFFIIGLIVVAVVVCFLAFAFDLFGTGDGVAEFNTYLYLRYQLWLSTHKIPNHFVTFDQINMNNEFKFESFRLPSNKYRRYRYDFTLSNGFCLTLHVRHEGYHVTYDREVIDLPEGIDDVRDFSATAEQAVVRVNDIEYSFVQDMSTGKYKLYGVTTVIDGIQFKWYMNDSRYPDEVDFPDDPDSFIERLLHASTATQARDEFAAAIRSEKPSQLGWKILFFGTPVVVVGGVVAFFVIRKKKAKAKANT